MAKKSAEHLSPTIAKIALGKGNEAFKVFLSEYSIDVNYFYRDKETILHTLMHRLKNDCFFTLLSFGPNILLKTKTGDKQTALHLAALNDSDYYLRPMLSTLQKQGRLQDGLTCRDDLNNTPLHYACQRGDEPCIEVLLGFGADGTLKNAEGKTPYDLLLEKDAQLAAKYNARLSQPQAPKKPGMTMFGAPHSQQKQPSPPQDGSLHSGSGSSGSSSPKSSSSEGSPILSHKQAGTKLNTSPRLTPRKINAAKPIGKLLSRTGMDADRDLLTAVTKGNYAWAKELLERHHANPNYIPNDGIPSLYRALIFSNDEKLILLLIKFGAYVNTTLFPITKPREGYEHFKGLTPLMVAASKSPTNILKILIEAGADYSTTIPACKGFDGQPEAIHHAFLGDKLDNVAFLFVLHDTKGKKMPVLPISAGMFEHCVSQYKIQMKEHGDLRANHYETANESGKKCVVM